MLVPSAIVLVVVALLIVRAFRALARHLEAKHTHATQQILDQLPVGVFVVDPGGNPTYVSSAARSILGTAADGPIDMRRVGPALGLYEAGTDRIFPESRMPGRRALLGEIVEISDMEVRRDGESVPLHMRAAPLRDRDGHIDAVIIAFQDVRELQQRAMRDRLTGLPNRASVYGTFHRLRPGRLAVGILDLDHLKAVNDAHGHAAGDRVLASVATAVVDALRPGDVVARWGGEELVVLFPDTDARGARRALEQALDAVRELRFDGKDGERFGVTFSAGAVLAGAYETLDETVARADAALDGAKRGGRARVHHDGPVTGVIASVDPLAS